LAIALRTLASGHSFAAADDTVVSPTYVPDLVPPRLDDDGEVWSVASGESGAITWADLALRCQQAGLDAKQIESRPAALGLAAPRPAYSALSSERVFTLCQPGAPATCAILVVLFRDAESLIHHRVRNRKASRTKKSKLCKEFMQLQVECNSLSKQQPAGFNQSFEMSERVIVCDDQGDSYGEVCSQCLSMGFNWIKISFSS